MEDVGAVLAGLAGASAPLVDAVRENVDSETCDAFAWRLFELWLSAGAPSNYAWAMPAVGRLGGDGSVLRMAKLIAAWPGEGQSKRAANGIGVLAAIGTDAALFQISELADRTKYKALRARADVALVQVAEDRGLSREELNDHIVPTCGLDDAGRRTFDYGTRRFAFTMGAGLRLGVRELDSDGRPAGKLRPGLPPATQKDDAERVTGAKAAWDVLKKQVSATVKTQSDRLQKAMVAQRRWTPDAFGRLFMRHPLQSHLARTLVWGAWQGGSSARPSGSPTSWSWPPWRT